jgi:4-nitrophenyl phosphatase
MIDFRTVRAVLFDMDGVVYRGKTRLPGVAEVIQFCDSRGVAYACITNNASKTAQQFEEKLAAMDISLPGSRVFSSALVTGHYLRMHYPRGTTAFVVGMDGLREAIFGDGYFVEQAEQPELVVQGVDLQVTYDRLKTASLAIRAGARFILTNPDKAFPSEEGLLPGSGALAAFLQAASDVEPFVVGKPQPTLFRTAMEVLQATPDTTLVVGDRLETDIAGARDAGLRSALVLTGVTQREHLETTPYQPDAVFADLTVLLDEWKRQTSDG